MTGREANLPDSEDERMAAAHIQAQFDLARDLRDKPLGVRLAAAKALARSLNEARDFDDMMRRVGEQVKR